MAETTQLPKSTLDAIMSAGEESTNALAKRLGISYYRCNKARQELTGSAGTTAIERIEPALDISAPESQLEEECAAHTISLSITLGTLDRWWARLEDAQKVEIFAANLAFSLADETA